MNIPLTPPPSNIPPELERWLADLQIQISGALQEKEEVIRRVRVDLDEVRQQVIKVKKHVGMP